MRLRPHKHTSLILAASLSGSLTPLTPLSSPPFPQRVVGRLGTLSAFRGRPSALAFAKNAKPQRFAAPALCLQMSGGSSSTASLGKTAYVKKWLEGEVQDALQRAFGDDVKDANPMVTAATKPEFGDYQCNAAMPLAKALKSKPRDVAEKLCDELKASIGDAFEDPEIAGPGFLNLRFAPGPLLFSILGLGHAGWNLGGVGRLWAGRWEVSPVAKRAACIRKMCDEFNVWQFVLAHRC